MIVRPPFTGFIRPAGGGGGPAPPFDFEWQADVGLGLSDDDPVTTWADQSGNGNDATQGTGGAKPTFKATAGPGGLPCVRFDGGDFLTLTTALARSDYTLFAVLKPGGTGVRTILEGLAGSFGWRIGNPNTISVVVCNTTNIGASNTALSGSGFQQINVRWDGTTATFRINSTADGAVANAQSLSADITTIGKNPQGNNEFYVDDFCMIGGMLSVLSDGDVQAVEAELATRWGVS